MKLNWCKLAIMALALGVFTACSEDDEPNGEVRVRKPEEVTILPVVVETIQVESRLLV